jgi:hypothetical protein
MWAKWSSKNKPVRSWGRRHGQTVSAWRAIDYGYVQTTDWWQTVELVKIARGAWFCSVCINATNTTCTPVSQVHSMIVVLARQTMSYEEGQSPMGAMNTNRFSVGHRRVDICGSNKQESRYDKYMVCCRKERGVLRSHYWTQQLWCMILQMAKICVGIWSISGGNKKDCTTFSEIIQQQNQKPTLFWENRGRRYTKKK